jgi:tetratricopeptide (TPR) repeat protein
LYKAGEIPKDAQELYFAGNRLLLTAHYEDAVKKFEDALKIYPKFADVYRGLGVCFAKLNKQDKAIESYEKYLDLNPQAKDADMVRQIIKEYKKK